jgi:hypothetical protein
MLAAASCSMLATAQPAAGRRACCGGAGASAGPAAAVRRASAAAPFATARAPVAARQRLRAAAVDWAQDGAAPESVVAPAPPAGVDPAAVQRLKFDILRAVAPLDRGSLASPRDRRAIDALVARLEASGGGAAAPLDVALDGGAPIDGTWELVYSTTEQFRSSPFFWAFEKLVPSPDAARAIFSFTDGLFGMRTGTAVQTINVAAGRLVSKVELVMPPGLLRGWVVTSCTLQQSAGAADTLSLTVESTRIENSASTGWLEGIAVPVQAAFEAVRGPGGAVVEARVSFCDADLRAARLPDNSLFIYRRRLEG